MAFDSAGHAVRLSDQVAALAAAVAEGDVRKGLAAIRPAVSRPLSADEQAQARALATWLWQRRCPGG